MRIHHVRGPGYLSSGSYFSAQDLERCMLLLFTCTCCSNRPSNNKYNLMPYTKLRHISSRAENRWGIVQDNSQLWTQPRQFVRCMSVAFKVMVLISHNRGNKTRKDTVAVWWEQVLPPIPPFQIISHCDFFRYIYFAMHLDIIIYLDT
jgi:hypothetical protein